MNHRCVLSAFGLCLTLLGALACATPPVGPYATPDVNTRDAQRAAELTSEAVACLARDPDQAEVLLREALTADLFFGPAHNNLGVLHLKRAKLYEAANEFEWARKLMPGHPDPRLNLGLVLERAGHIDEALEAYRASLEVATEYLPALQASARLMRRTGRRSAELDGMVKTIALRGDTAAWRDWAQRELVRMQAPAEKP